MANYCNNTLKVVGTKKDIDNFLMENTSVSSSYYPNKDGKYELDVELDFEKVIPTPKKENGEDIDNWYEWRLENWGTKWNVSSTFSFSVKRLSKEEDKVELFTAFETPWSPPHGIFNKLVDKYKDTTLELTMEYYEGGVGFAGECSATEGEIIEEKYYEHNKDKEEYLIYIIEKEHEALDWLDEYLCECMEEDGIEDEIIDQISLEFNKFYKRKDFKSAAQLFLAKAKY